MPGHFQYMGHLIEAGAILAIAGFAIKTHIDVNKKVDNNFERLDKVKEELVDQHVRKDMCQVLHDQVRRDLSEIKTDVKLILKRNGGLK